MLVMRVNASSSSVGPAGMQVSSPDGMLDVDAPIARTGDTLDRCARAACERVDKQSTLVNKASQGNVRQGRP